MTTLHFRIKPQWIQEINGFGLFRKFINLFPFKWHLSSWSLGATRISYTRWLRTWVVATILMESHNSKKELPLQWNRWVQAAWKLHSSANQDDASKNLIYQPAGKSVPYLHSWQSTSCSNSLLEQKGIPLAMKRWRLGIAIQVCQTPDFGFELSALFLLPGFYKSCLAMSKGTHTPCVAEPGFHRNIQKLRKTCEQIHTIFATITFVQSYQIPQLMSAFHHQRTKNSSFFFSCSKCRFRSTKFSEVLQAP